MNEFQTVLIEKKREYTTIWLNRPLKRNALNGLMMEELIKVVDLLNSDEQQRVIIIRGKGKIFSAGADLDMMRNLGGQGKEKKNWLPQCLQALYNSPIPVVAAAHGSVYGGANGILAACDISLAGSDTVFAFSEVKIGLVPAVIAPYVIKRIGEARAREYMLTGMKFTALDAEKTGLINKSLPEDSIEDYLENLVGNILENGPEAVKTCKSMISRIAGDWDFHQALGETERLIRQISSSDEARERIEEFFLKKK